MGTKTRLRIVLILCASALTLNVFAVVEEFYALPEAKAAETTLQGHSLVVSWHSPATHTRNINLMSQSYY